MFPENIAVKIKLDDIENNCISFEQLSKISQKSKELFFDKLEIDFSNVKFFDANMTATLYAVLSRYYENLNEVSLVRLPEKIKEIFQ